MGAVILYETPFLLTLKRCLPISNHMGFVPQEKKKKERDHSLRPLVFLSTLYPSLPIPSLSSILLSPKCTSAQPNTSQGTGGQALPLCCPDHDATPWLLNGLGLIAPHEAAKQQLPLELRPQDTAVSWEGICLKGQYCATCETWECTLHESRSSVPVRSTMVPTSCSPE